MGGLTSSWNSDLQGCCKERIFSPKEQKCLCCQRPWAWVLTFCCALCSMVFVTIASVFQNARCRQLSVLWALNIAKEADPLRTRKTLSFLVHSPLFSPTSFLNRSGCVYCLFFSQCCSLWLECWTRDGGIPQTLWNKRVVNGAESLFSFHLCWSYFSVALIIWAAGQGAHGNLSAYAA